MPSYKHATFNEYERSDGLYQVPNQIRWIDILSRDDFYDYDTNIQDNDYLLVRDEIRLLQELHNSEFLISEKFSCRPDLLCKYIYDEVDYWWILMLYNNYDDWDDVVAGSKILIPDKSEIDSWLLDMKFNSTRRNNINVRN